MKRQRFLEKYIQEIIDRESGPLHETAEELGRQCGKLAVVEHYREDSNPETWEPCDGDFRAMEQAGMEYHEKSRYGEKFGEIFEGAYKHGVMLELNR